MMLVQPMLEDELTEFPHGVIDHAAAKVGARPRGVTTIRYFLGKQPGKSLVERPDFIIML
jgi:hypothetical protein